MDYSSDPTKSRIPRPSRLPVPRTNLRASQSNDALKSNKQATGGLVVPRLRSQPSREQITPKPTQPRASYVVPRDRTIPPTSRAPARNTVRPQKSHDTFRRSVAPSSRPTELAEADTFANESFDDNVVEEAVSIPSSTPKRQPSLMERTVETLAQLPPSPAVRSRRQSTFFDRPPSQASNNSSRPGSSYLNDASMPPPRVPSSSRPASSAGPQISGSHRTPLRPRASASTLGTNTRQTSYGESPSRVSSLSSPKLPSSGEETSPSSKSFSSSIRGSSVSSRSLNPRASVNGLSRKSSYSVLRQEDGASDIEGENMGVVRSQKLPTTRKFVSSFHTPKRPQAIRPPDSPQTEENNDATPRKSSLALREQIAKAKAAKKAQMSKSRPREPEVPMVPQDAFDFGLNDDPFNLKQDQGSQKEVLRRKVTMARSDGRLNIAAMGLKEIPEEVMNMYSLDSLDGGSWAECVDLTRFIAADNEIEAIPDEIFPDASVQELAEHEESQGNQFGGLEALDLHGNLLRKVPLGLRRLELLTSLNLSNNKLDTSSLETISQIPALRELKLSSNALAGALDESISKLVSLEVLELQRNELSSLPSAMASLKRLRVLNVAENQLTLIPFDSLQSLPLVELHAAKNKLEGVLIGAEVEELSRLQTLDVMSNALLAISRHEIRLPALRQLNCSNNRVKSLPDVSSWSSLTTLFAEDNSLSDLPVGFAALTTLKTVDLSGNDIKVLDSKVGLMENLDILRITANPLRERKLAGMTTEDLKKTLKGRCTPDVTDTALSDTDSIYGTPTGSPPGDEWPVKPGGVLDRSETDASSLNPVIVANIASKYSIQTLQLHHNKFSQIPDSVAFFANTLTTMNLSHNEFTSDTYLKETLQMPALKELNLSSNTLSSLQPLLQHLEAPRLEKLDVSFNRLSALPTLRNSFPSLVILLASNNKIQELLPDTIKGLRLVDCSSNDINALNARIGLLGGPGGLERLDVSGNRFRVPKYTILEKGTEATLAWLRDRIPADELPPASADDEVD